MAINNAESNPRNPQQKTHHHQHQTMNDDPVERLKSLNARLVKETAEKRQQVDLLTQSNGRLESEFNRVVMEKDSVKLEMDELVEKVAVLEIEKGLVFDFVNVQVKEGVEMKKILEEKREIERLVSEKESEIGDLKKQLDQMTVEINEEKHVSSRVSEERDEIKALLDGRIREVEDLQDKLTKAEENEARVLKEVEELMAKCDGLVAENADSERRIESLTKEKDDVETSLVVSKGVVDELERNVVKLVEQNKAVVDEKVVLDGKNLELEAKVDELKKVVESMQTEEQTLLEKVADLEKKYAASSSHEAEMKVEIDKLAEEKRVTERRIEDLGEEKSVVVKDLEDAKKELEQQKLLYDRIVQEKTELEDAKQQGESEKVKMNEQITVFKDTISSLEAFNTDQTEKVKELEVEVGSYKSSLNETVSERDEALQQLNNEKAITTDLKQKITGMENEMEGLNEKLASLATENEKNIGEKNKLEGQCAGLVKEVAVLEAKFAASRVEFDGKLGAAEANMKRVLNILKKTASGCYGDSDLDQENGVEEEIKEHLAGIEEIKKAFKDKEGRLEEMKMQLELVKGSVEEARKEKKGFWTMVSSATTLLVAAVSVAYVARAH